MWMRESLAWAAGIVEGEGSILSTKRNATSLLRYVTLQVPMSDLDILERLQALFGGSICSQPSDGKPMWIWRISASPKAYAVVVALWPWLGVRRRQQATVAITAWVQTGRQRIADLATCPTCGGPREQYLSQGRPDGWRCRPCLSAKRKAVA